MGLEIKADQLGSQLPYSGRNNWTFKHYLFTNSPLYHPCHHPPPLQYSHVPTLQISLHQDYVHQRVQLSQLSVESVEKMDIIVSHIKWSLFHNLNMYNSGQTCCDPMAQPQQAMHVPDQENHT